MGIFFFYKGDCEELAKRNKRKSRVMEAKGEDCVK